MPREDLSSLLGPDGPGWGVLEKLVAQGRPVMERMKQESRAPDAPTSWSLQKRVEHRMKLGRTGKEMATLSFTELTDSAPAYKKGQPPEENSMMHTIEQLYKIVVTDFGSVSSPAYHRVSSQQLVINRLSQFEWRN
jgi:hypothetical protein